VKGSLLVLLSGALFGWGLGIAGMTQPAKVVGFLDFFGDWDPSLAFVLGGAILAYLPLSRLIHRRSSPLFGAGFQLPQREEIDGRLLGGAAVFGVGWGLGGFCPGPALTSSGSGSSSALVFTAAMLAGFLVYALLLRVSLRTESKRDRVEA
jgi:uncharacterized membrane protein YedE/YeeE